MSGWIEPRGIAVSVGVVVVAHSRERPAPGRLDKLPHVGEWRPAIGRAGRLFRKDATRGWRAGILGDPIGKLSPLRVVANIVSSHDTGLAFFGWNARAINARAEAGGGDRIGPGIDVALLLGQHAPAFFDIQKNDGLGGKPLAMGGCNRGLCVCLCQGNGILLQLLFQPAIEKDEKAEARGFEDRTLASPGIALRSGRIVEPVSGIREGLTKSLEVRVAGIVVAVETQERVVGSG